MLEGSGLDKKNLAGFCSDTCSVMHGVNHSLSTLLREDKPDIFVQKCGCHSIHLVGQYASLKLPKVLEDVVRGVCTTFSRSPQKRDDYVKFQKLAEVESHVFITPAVTRYDQLPFINQGKSNVLYIFKVVNPRICSPSNPGAIPCPDPLLH